ncbi:MAG: hypothetical protein ACKVT0_11415 [Planctomycetaceae bacterium]
MSIICECPDCGKKYRVDDSKTGRTIPCKECGGDIHVRKGSSQVASRRFQQDDDDDDDDRVWRSRSNSSSTASIVIGGGILGIVAIGVLVILVTKGGDPAENRREQQVAENEWAPEPIQPQRFPVPEVPPVPQPVFPPGGNSPPVIIPSPHGIHDERRDAARESIRKRMEEARQRRARQFPRFDTPPNSGNTTANATPTRVNSGNGSGGFGSAGRSGSSIPFNERDGFTAGPPGCPFVVSGKHVWDIAQKKIIAELQGEYNGRGLTALSPDGLRFAAADKTPNQMNTSITVWDTQTGQQLFVAPGDPERFADVVLLSNDKLFIGGRNSNLLYVWNIANKRVGQTIGVGDGEFNKGSTAITIDGEFFATIADDKLNAHKTSTAQIVAVMGDPASVVMIPGESLLVRDNKLVADSRSNSSNARFNFTGLQSLEFSADSEELAGVSTHPIPRVMCWNNRGELIYDQPLYSEQRAPWENTLQWFPDRKSWLIEFELFDRESGKTVLSIRERFGQHLRIHVLDDNHLIGSLPHSPEQIEILEIPWGKIRQSLEQIKTGEDALMSPSNPVSIVLDDGSNGAQQNSVGGVIVLALTNKLARDNIKVQPGQTTYFRLRFSESAGDRLPIFERQSPFDFRGRDTGRTVMESRGALVVELIVEGEAQPIWRQTLLVESSKSFDQLITDDALRQTMLHSLAMRIDLLDIPFFVPKSKDQVALPLVIQ